MIHIISNKLRGVGDSFTVTKPIEVQMQLRQWTITHFEMEGQYLCKCPQLKVPINIQTMHCLNSQIKFRPG
jgi:hypothetical protein